MDFIVFNDELEGYWPTAGEAPDAGAHTKSHSRWYNGVKKIVASRTLAASKSPNVRVVGDDIVGALRAEKQKAGGDIMIFGSPTLTRALAAADLVDEWRLTLQPVILGGGLPLFESARTARGSRCARRRRLARVSWRFTT